jgi:hypothetical protein
MIQHGSGEPWPAYEASKRHSLTPRRRDAKKNNERNPGTATENTLLSSFEFLGVSAPLRQSFFLPSVALSGARYD